MSQLGALLEMIAKARDLRLVVWEDSFVSSSRFADLQLNAIEHWTDFEKRPRAYLRLGRRQARAGDRARGGVEERRGLHQITERNGLRRRRAGRVHRRHDKGERVGATLGELALWRRRGPGGGPVRLGGAGGFTLRAAPRPAKDAVARGAARMCL